MSIVSVKSCTQLIMAIKLNNVVLKPEKSRMMLSCAIHNQKFYLKKTEEMLLGLHHSRSPSQFFPVLRRDVLVSTGTHIYVWKLWKGPEMAGSTFIDSPTQTDLARLISCLLYGKDKNNWIHLMWLVCTDWCFAWERHLAKFNSSEVYASSLLFFSSAFWHVQK